MLVPQLSVITATLDAGPDLARLARSLESQQCRDFEWIVVDGGSSDAAKGIVEACAVDDKTLIREPDRGLYDALNKGIRRARADFYLVAGADDVLAPGAVAAFVAAIQRGGADLVTAPVAVGEGVARASRRWGRFRSGPPTVSAHSLGTAIRTRLHQIHGEYSLDFPIAADTHFLRKVVRDPNTRITYLREIAGRFGTGGLSSRNRLRTLCESFRANVEAGEPLLLQWLLFSLRLIKNGRRIHQDRSAR